jgi:hypothetical protein
MTAARPPDVRKGFAFPSGVIIHLRGYASVLEAEPPEFQKIGLPVRQSLPAHQAAKPLRTDP